MDEAKVKRGVAILGWVGFAIIIGLLTLILKMLRP